MHNSLILDREDCREHSERGPTGTSFPNALEVTNLRRFENEWSNGRSRPRLFPRSNLNPRPKREDIPPLLLLPYPVILVGISDRSRSLKPRRKYFPSTSLTSVQTQVTLPLELNKPPPLLPPVTLEQPKMSKKDPVVRVRKLVKIPIIPITRPVSRTMGLTMRPQLTRRPMTVLKRKYHLTM